VTALFAESALLPEGWARDVRVSIGPDGDIAGIDTGAEPGEAERLAGPILPGMPNLHSHAFQRAMAGLTECSSGTGEDFWSWRQAMYRFLAVLQPEHIRAIAAQLYLEMVKAGYTAVGEFHYLHHDRDGAPYADRASTSLALIEAAQEVGIGLTLLPTLYQANGFDGVPPEAGQRRFIDTVDGILRLIEQLRQRTGADPQLRIGLALHSLRAVPADALAEAVAGLRTMDASAPIHIHVAEQLREVEECVAWSGQRPVAWLLDHAPVDETWCLVHATHMDESETTRLAAARAVAGLCPTTEANLGDGFFPLLQFLAAGGRWGIGSDSHVSVNPIEELRWLEYGRRLRLRRRAVSTGGRPGSTGCALWHGAVEGGRQALARPVGRLATGSRADLVVLNTEAPTLYGKVEDALLDSFIFAGSPALVRDVMIGGRWVVRQGRHAAQERIDAAFRGTLDQILRT
jgi:formimidoylglutamate deiminase